MEGMKAIDNCDKKLPSSSGPGAETASIATIIVHLLSHLSLHRIGPKQLSPARRLLLVVLPDAWLVCRCRSVALSASVTAAYFISRGFSFL